MRRTITVLSAAVLAVGVTPAGADDELVECENPQGLEVLTRDGLETDIATPHWLIGNESETEHLLVDLSPAKATTTGFVTVVLTWDVELNDYDLEVGSSMDFGNSEDYQPFDPPVETVPVQARHCDTLEVTALEYGFWAPVVVASLELDLSVSNVVTPATPGAQ